MSGLRRLIGEIHRRSLWQVLGVYLAGSWVALQVVEQLAEAAGLPAWIRPLALALLVIGFPIVMATAFVQEGIGGRDGRETITASPAAAADQAGVASEVRMLPVTGARRLFTWRNAIAGGVLAFAALGVAGTGWILLGPGTIGSTSISAGDSDLSKTIAVLPFTSGDERNEAFRIGIHDALLTQLAKVRDLRVISRTSMLEYEGTTKNMRQIGDELGVANLLEGSVQRAEDVVQINVQLVDAASDEHRWAESYTRDLSAANLIAVQSEIVRDIARAMRAVLAPEEEILIAEVPTENLEAYDLFLQARDVQQRGGGEDTVAITLLERAVRLDPSFALAWAYLSKGHSDVYWDGVDRTRERTELAREAVDRALELRPQLPEAHMALGEYYYRAHRDYESALTELTAARDQMGEQSELVATIAAVQRRQGAFEEAAAGFRRAAELDPRSIQYPFDLGQTLWILGRFEEAERSFDRIIALAPDHPRGYANKARTRLYVTGDPAEARRVLDSFPGTEDRPWFQRYRFSLLERDPAAALAELFDQPEMIPAQYGEIPKSFYAGEALYQMGEMGRAQAAYDSARVVLERIVAERPENETARGNLAWVYARLGRAGDAVRTAGQAVELFPDDALILPPLLVSIARTYAAAGEPELALDQLDAVVEMGRWYYGAFELDPAWDPIRDHPRFQTLVERERAARVTS